MKIKSIIFLLAFMGFSFINAKGQINSSPDTPLRVIAIFAHPDDAESKMGGTAVLMARAGHQVKFISITNGDAGHHEIGGGPLGVRRRAEAQESAKRLGIAEYEVWDYHDGELLPELHIRKNVIRAIRKWNADVVIGLRPNDYHPDHRSAAQLVIDASYMVIVPNVAADTPPVKNNPVFLYMQDRFTKPNPLSHDIVVGIDEVIETKALGLDAHVSQMYEWGAYTGGRLGQIPEDTEGRLEMMRKRNRKLSDEQRAGLLKWYGKDKASQFKYAESFEIAEYGKQPSENEIRMIFPMLKK